MAKHQSFEVAIIGSGITGLSTAWHLHSRGLKKIALFHDPARAGESSPCPGLLWGGMFDNYSRLTHHHGISYAQELWRFGDESFDALSAFATEQGVPHASHSRLRLITSPEELVEAEKAVAQLVESGFSAHLTRLPAEEHGRAYGLQRDSGRGGWIESKTLLAALQRKAGAKIVAQRVRGFSLDGQGISLQLATGEEVRSQILVLACHLAIAELLPVFGEVLVPVVNQWLQLSLPEGISTEAEKLVSTHAAFSAHHTYEWGAFLPRSLIIGGGNYLRKFAGIGETNPRYEEKIARHLTTYAAKIFSLPGDGLTREREGVGLEIRPCDELPIIGPMFGENRLLLATGYMGQGLTLGFNAGRCLAELITQGKSPRLPRGLWPERFRATPEA